MKCGLGNHWSVDTALLLNRLSLGLYMVLAGVSRVADEIGRLVYGTFKSLTPNWLPPWSATPYGYSLPWVEVVAGTLLLVGLFGRAAAGTIALMLVSFTIGVGVRVDDGPFSTNVVLCTLALLLAVSGSGGYSLDALIFRLWRK